MLIQEFGATFIGYSGEMHCANCGKSAPMHIFQDYIKQSVVFIPLGKMHSSIYYSCPTCERKEYIVKNTFMGGGGEMYRRLNDMLDAGKESTKWWFQGLPSKEKEGVLKRLNSVKAYTVISHIMK